MNYLKIGFLIALFYQIGMTANQMVDFTYSNYNQRTSKSASALSIKLQQMYSFNEQLKFPNACYLFRQLQKQYISGNNRIEVPPNYDFTNLKSNFLELLKISDQMRSIRQSLQSINGLPQKIVAKYQISQVGKLSEDELQLKRLSDQIEENTKKLELLVTTEDNSGYYEFISIKYKVEALELKLIDLKRLYQQTEKRQKNLDNQNQEILHYFSQMKSRFLNEDDMLHDLDQYWIHAKKLIQLKEKIYNLNDQIQGHKLLLEQKKICEEEVVEIKKKHQNQHYSQQLIQTIKGNYRRQDFECEDIVINLRQKIKKIFLIYNQSFTCSQGIQELQDEIRRQKEQLRLAQLQLKKLQGQIPFKDKKKKYEQILNEIKLHYQDLKKIKIDGYSHSTSELNRLIQKTNKQLQQQKYKLRNFEYNKKPQKQINNQALIKKYIIQIKQKKLNYCQKVQIYEKKAQILWKKIYQHEQSIKFQSNMKLIWKNQMQKLYQLEHKFTSVKEEILSKLR